MRPIVLGSGSAIRARILRDAGVPFAVERPRVDEDVLKRGMVGAEPAAVAIALAEAKAVEVSARLPDALVIGADQTLEFEGRLYDKPRDAEGARARLKLLRGREHRLNAGTALAIGGKVVWSDLQVSRLLLRCFTDAWLEDYLSRAGGALTATVGGYEYEGLGGQMLEGVEGDYFAILGLPLLALLGALRAHGGLPS